MVLSQRQRWQRYYQKSFNYATAPAQSAGFTSNTGVFIYTALRAGALSQYVQAPLPGGRMRVASGGPGGVLTTYNPSAANANVRDTTGSVDGTVSSAQLSESFISLQLTGNAATAVGNTMGIHWTADAEL
jgi:hypothetical protein